MRRCFGDNENAHVASNDDILYCKMKNAYKAFKRNQKRHDGLKIPVLMRMDRLLGARATIPTAKYNQIDWYYQLEDGDYRSSRKRYFNEIDYYCCRKEVIYTTWNGLYSTKSLFTNTNCINSEICSNVDEQVSEVFVFTDYIFYYQLD
uniref:Uncharacterized protein n=1 Tax=Onchocerca volvulus TaxID=6282 RepID=A0A8R1TR50_ONCVO